MTDWVRMPLGRNDRGGRVLAGRWVVGLGRQGWFVVDRRTDEYTPGFATLGDAMTYAEAAQYWDSDPALAWLEMLWFEFGIVFG